MSMCFFLMIRGPPRSTRTDTLLPYTTLFRAASVRVTSGVESVVMAGGIPRNWGYAPGGHSMAPGKFVVGRGREVQRNVTWPAAESHRPGRKDRKSTRLNSSH